MQAPIFINGRFAAQALTGVQRTATALVSALDEALLPAEGARWTLLCPAGVHLPLLKNMAVRSCGRAGMPLHAWEQLVLPWEARTGLLVSLAGAAPWFSRRQACLLHDAAVFDVPQAYGRHFAWWYRTLFRRLARKAQPLFTVSRFSQQRLAASLPVTESHLHTVPNAADHLRHVTPDATVLQRLGLQPGAFALHVASENPSKNSAALLQAWTRVSASRTAPLVWVGRKSARVFAPLQALPAAALVHRVLDASDAELVALYRAARLLVVPSLYEGFGLPALEAMTCGCPVAAARAGALPEVCADAAAYFDPTDPADMARVLQTIWDDEPQRQRLRQAGEQRAQEFSWQASAAHLKQALLAAVGSAA